VGVCRLCAVDVGGRVLAAACVRECEEGMTVRTTGHDIDRHARMLTALLLADHPVPCERERTTGDCALEALGRRYGLLDAGGSSSLPEGLRPSPPLPGPRHDRTSPVIAVDHHACILCDRCVRACNEVQSNEVIGRGGKGAATRIAFDLDRTLGESTCVACGECAAACPTGALTDKPRTLPLLPHSRTKAVDTVCPYCGVGCALTYHVWDNVILKAQGRDSPVNRGRLCVKGRYGWDYALHRQRLTAPLIRRAEAYPRGALTDPASRNGQGAREAPAAFREATWEEALALVADQLLAIKAAHGPRALAGFGSAKGSNEEAYLFQKLMRAALGTNNVDHCTRLCHASSVAALLETIGSGAVTDVFADARHAEVLLLTGTNTTANHPVAATFFKDAAKRGAKLIVVDPRRPPIADYAAWYCQIRPGTDVAFYNALMHVLVAEGLTDEAFVRARTDGFEALRALVAGYPPERVAPLCGIDADTIRVVAQTVGRARTMMIFWGMGVSQHTHGTDNARCLVSLCLLTGNVGRPGTGLHPLRGQNNVQGASDAGLVPMFYPDYQSVGSAAARAKFEAAWGARLDPDPGLTVVEVMAGARAGRVRGMLIMGENPSLSDPDRTEVGVALSRLEFLAVQDLFLTETAEFADVVLPAASFLEKTGTYTNTDRRVQLGRKVLDPPGGARPDADILCDLAARLGYPMSYDTPEAVFAEFAGLTANYRGLTYARLGRTGRLWPCPDPDAPDGQAVLFPDRFPTPTGRARFVPCPFTPEAELPDAEYPLVLNTGRLLEHYLTGTMTRRSTALDALRPGPFVEVHPADMARYGLTDGGPVTVRSRRGSVRLTALAGRAVQPGSVFIPFHFREAAANALTRDELDPHGKIPAFKYCAVAVEPV
jgi:formate dehydrogenase major subunit